MQALGIRLGTALVGYHQGKDGQVWRGEHVVQAGIDCSVKQH